MFESLQNPTATRHTASLDTLDYCQREQVKRFNANEGKNICQIRSIFVFMSVSGINLTETLAQTREPKLVQKGRAAFVQVLGGGVRDGFDC